MEKWIKITYVVSNEEEVVWTKNQNALQRFMTTLIAANAKLVKFELVDRFGE